MGTSASAERTNTRASTATARTNADDVLNPPKKNAAVRISADDTILIPLTGRAAARRKGRPMRANETVSGNSNAAEIIRVSIVPPIVGTAPGNGNCPT
jgi:hypothetical protein